MSERLATLYRASRGECDVLVVAATTALLSPGAARLPRRAHVLPQAGRHARRRGAARATGAGRLRARDAGGVAGRIQRARRADRPVSRWAATLPYRIDLFDDDIETHPHLRRRHAAHALPGAGRAPAAGARVPARRRPGARASAAAFARPSKAIRRSRRSTRTSPTASPPAASSTTCRCSSTPPRRWPTTCRRRRRGGAARRRARRGRALLATTRSRAIGCCAATSARPLLPPTELFLPPDDFNGVLQAVRADRDRAVPPAAQLEPRRRAARARPCRCRSVAGGPPRRRSAGGARSAFSRPRRMRWLIVAESAGRRETMQQYFAEYGLQPGPGRRTSPRLGRTRRSVCSGRRAAGHAASSGPTAGWPSSPRAELYAGVVRRSAREAARRSNVDAHGARPVRGAHRRPGGARAARHRPLPGPGRRSTWATARPNSCSWSTPTTPSSTCRCRNLHLIGRYSGAAPEAAPLHKLGSGAVGKGEEARPRSRCATPPPSCSTSTRSARRAKATRSASSAHDYEAFAEGFGFEETADQAAAIEAVIDDMTSGKPMDRLVCGDVGFGKTEVALRAAFVALADGKQVARAGARRRCWPSSTSRPSPTASPTGRCRSPSCRASAPRKETKAALAGLADGPGRHRHRHAQAAAARRQVQATWAW